MPPPPLATGGPNRAPRPRITGPGLQYSLLMPCTRFPAADRVLRAEPGGQTPAANPPPPMRQGLAATAVGAGMAGMPQPAGRGAALVALSLLAMVARRARRHDPRRFTA